MTALTARELTAQIKHLDQSRRADDFRPVALQGTGEGGVVSVSGLEFEVVPVVGELEMRAHLATDAQRPQRPIVYLVDFADQLPLDIACRLRGARVHTVGVAQRLADRFGARSVAPGLAQTSVARRALTLADGAFRPVSHSTLSADDVWEAVLADLLQGPPPRPSVGAWLRFTVTHPGGAALKATLEEDGLAAELDAWLGQPHHLGPTGPALRKAWTEGSATELLGWLLLLQANEAHQDPTLNGVLTTLLASVYEPLADRSIVSALLAVVDEVLEALTPAARHEAAAVAESKAKAHLAVLTRHSRWLRSGHAALQEDLGEALTLAATDPDAVPRVWKLVDELGEHDRTTAEDRLKLDHAARLATWLAWRRARALDLEDTWCDAIHLAKDYVRHGGHADWCRATVRAHATGDEALDAGMQAVLVEADALRREDDQRFATALVGWHAADRPRKDLLPLHRATHEVLRPFLEGHADRRLMVVMMDGMSHANLAQLMASKHDWRPLVGRDPRPVLAGLPTITAVSRAGFFAGKDLPAHGDQPEGRDLDRWRHNVPMRPFADEQHGPRLFTKADLGSRLSDVVLKTVADDSERVVAFTINAVDDDLSGPMQLEADLSKASIPVLDKLLDLAHQHQRVVLLVADHGHVAGSHMERRPLEHAVHNGQRYRTLDPGESPLAEEVELPSKGWHPRGATRLAAFWDERPMWNLVKKGAHGGVTLAEVVVPCVLMAPEWLFYARDKQDDGLRTVPPELPPWWSGALPPTRVVYDTPAQTTPQGDLFGSKPEPREVVDTTPDAHHPLVAQLERHPLFVQRCDGREAQRDELLLALDTVLRTGGPGPQPAMRLDLFADALGVPARRVQGRIAQLQFFQLDGETLLEADRPGGRVIVHRDRLIMQYGLEP